MRLTINNIGPIKKADLALNKINVIIGAQSSGKSTIAKIASFCTWVEKRYYLDGGIGGNFISKFMEFHRISESYFSPDSSFSYEGTNLRIFFCWADKDKVVIEEINGQIFRNSKNIYIPAERNFIFAIPNLGKYKRGNDNIMDFVYNWGEMRENYN